MMVQFQGGPLHGQRQDFPKPPAAYQPAANDGIGCYFRTGFWEAGCPIYEWSER